MFTLNFPIALPQEHYFFDDVQYPTPPLPGDLSINSLDLDDGLIVLRISGFKSTLDAIDFCPVLRSALRLAALDSEHSISPSSNEPVIAKEKLFDAHIPTVTPMGEEFRPYKGTVSQKNGLHISVLAKSLGATLHQGAASGAKIPPNLSVALELYSDCEFAGERNAQFIVLMTSLEVLVAKGNTKGKRGAVDGLVKQMLAKAGRSDWKTVKKTLDELYTARNALVHDAVSVTSDQLVSLKLIVRDTLKAASS